MSGIKGGIIFEISLSHLFVSENKYLQEYQEKIKLFFNFFRQHYSCAGPGRIFPKSIPFPDLVNALNSLSTNQNNCNTGSARVILIKRRFSYPQEV